jgi:hypothetical protein
LAAIGSDRYKDLWDDLPWAEWAAADSPALVAWRGVLPDGKPCKKGLGHWARQRKCWGADSALYDEAQKVAEQEKAAAADAAKAALLAPFAAHLAELEAIPDMKTRWMQALDNGRRFKKAWHVLPWVEWARSKEAGESFCNNPTLWLHAYERKCEWAHRALTQVEKEHNEQAEAADKARCSAEEAAAREAELVAIPDQDERWQRALTQERYKQLWPKLPWRTWAAQDVLALQQWRKQNLATLRLCPKAESGLCHAIIHSAPAVLAAQRAAQAAVDAAASTTNPADKAEADATAQRLRDAALLCELETLSDRDPSEVCQRWHFAIAASRYRHLWPTLPWSAWASACSAAALAALNAFEWKKSQDPEWLNKGMQSFAKAQGCMQAAAALEEATLAADAAARQAKLAAKEAAAAASAAQASAAAARHPDDLTDKRFVVMGGFVAGKFSIQSAIEACGGRLVDAVSRSVDFVVCGTPEPTAYGGVSGPGSKKHREAKALRLPILDEAAFQARVAAHKTAQQVQLQQVHDALIPDLANIVAGYAADATPDGAARYWKDVNQWLRESSGDSDTMPAPATDAAIAQLETDMRVALPPVLKQLWRVSNGGGGERSPHPVRFFPSVEQVRETWFDDGDARLGSGRRDFCREVKWISLWTEPIGDMGIYDVCVYVDLKSGLIVELKTDCYVWTGLTVRTCSATRCSCSAGRRYLGSHGTSCSLVLSLSPCCSG